MRGYKSRDDAIPNATFYVRGTEIPTGVAVGELLVVDTAPGEDRGVLVADVNFVFDGLSPLRAR